MSTRTVSRSARDDAEPSRSQPRTDQKGIASVEIAAAILRLVEANPSPMALKEIAAAMSFSASRTHHYLVSLIKCGLLEREHGTLRYRFGSLAMQVGLTALGRSGNNSAIVEALRSLRDEIGYSTAYTVWSDRGPLVTHSEEGRAGLSVTLRLGTVLPMINSPNAAVYIAWLPDARLKPVLEALAPGVLSLKQLVEIREHTRKEGGAHASGARSPQIAAVAAPVFGLGGLLTGAISTLGLIGQFDDTPRGKASASLHRRARELSASLSAGA